MYAQRRVYLDNSATTAMDDRVAQAMAPFFHERYGNPSSLHREGQKARQAVEQARQQIASLIGARPDEIVFTAGGTEADNLAIRGALHAHLNGPCHIVTSSIEHPAVLEVCRELGAFGVAVTELPVGGDGIVDPEDLERAIGPKTRLVSIMVANNVVGTIQPIELCASIARDHGVPFHTDAVQAVGKLRLDVGKNGIDLLSLSGHKIHGPKGIGALFVRSGLKLHPLICGGGQERGLRSGTENVSAIVGLGAAAEIAAEQMADECARLVRLREQLIEGVLAGIDGAYLIGHRYQRLPGHACFGFAGHEGEAIKLLLALDDAGFAVSSGSACSAHHGDRPSYVLTAIGFDPLRARGSLRISLGRFNDESDVQRFLEVLPAVIDSLRPIASHH